MGLERGPWGDEFKAGPACWRQACASRTGPRLSATFELAFMNKSVFMHG